jgi:hypothetical protein
MQSPNKVVVSTAPNGLGLEPMLGSSVRIHPFQFDRDLSIDVRLVRWPEEASFREELAEVGVPRILILGEHALPPTPWDEIEDWVRVPVARPELELRATTVARRADLRERPWLDRDGLLWFRDRWVVVPRGQGPVLEALVDSFGQVVRDDEIRAVFERSANSTHSEAVKTSMRRISDLLVPLGLLLKRMRGSGYLLERKD